MSFKFELKKWLVDSWAAVKFFTPLKAFNESGIHHFDLQTLVNSMVVGVCTNVTVSRPLTWLRGKYLNLFGYSEDSPVTGRKVADFAYSIGIGSVLYAGVLYTAGVNLSNIPAPVATGVAINNIAAAFFFWDSVNLARAEFGIFPERKKYDWVKEINKGEHINPFYK